MLLVHQNGDLPTFIFFKFLLRIYILFPQLVEQHCFGLFDSRCEESGSSHICNTYCSDQAHALDGVDEWVGQMNYLQVFNALQGSCNYIVI